MSKLSEGTSSNQPTVINEHGAKEAATPFRFDLVPPLALAEVAEILAEGAKKYGEGNWRGLSIETNLNHALQHIYAHLSGDENERHLSHAACRLMFALDIYIHREDMLQGD